MMDQGSSSVSETKRSDLPADLETAKSTVHKLQVVATDGIQLTGRQPYDVVLSGGAPWGFALNSGGNGSSALRISKIAPGGKASESILAEGDFVLQINNQDCWEVGQALDIVDTCQSTLTITVVRGQPNRPESGSLTSGQAKVPSSKSVSDDSVVYSKSKGHQVEHGVQVTSRNRRTNSFHVGAPVNGSTNKREVFIKAKSSSLTNSRNGVKSDRPTLHRSDTRQAHNDKPPITPNSDQQKRNLASMSRRRSEGPGMYKPVGLATPQQHASQHFQLPAAFSFASSTTRGPPVAGDDVAAVQVQHNSVQSNPSLSNRGRDQDHKTLDTLFSYDGPRSLEYNKFYDRPSNYSYNDAFTTIGNSSHGQFERRSLPHNNLQKYLPDYENIRLLGSSAIGSEKISEIDDIDEVTGKASNPQSPEVEQYDPLRGAGTPTRDPSGFKYTNLNQNHEKFPSWSVLQANGASRHSQAASSRIQSMTDHTNSSSEFPRNQQFANTPRLRSLSDKASPGGERKDNEGNSGDPGFKPEIVYGKYGGVPTRSQTEATEGQFDDLYRNARPLNIPSKQDSDKHRTGDKNYNAPSPLDRDHRGVDHVQLSQRLQSFDRLSQPNPAAPSPQNVNYVNSYTGSHSRPTGLNLDTNSSLSELNPARRDTSTSPLERVPISSSNINPKNISPLHTGSFEGSPLQQKNNVYSAYDQKQGNVSQPWPSRETLSSTSTDSQSSSHPILRARPSSERESPAVQNIQRDRFSSQHDRSAKGGQPDTMKSSGAFIVTTRPYYNTSTQTDSMPYAIKVSDPSSAKTKHAETQVEGISVQTSQTPTEEHKYFEEKSIQARMSRDFGNSTFNTTNQTTTNTNNHRSDYLRRPSSSNQVSPFKGIENIQAKYATDDPKGKTDDGSNAVPNFGDNASIMRKLSEEFYGHNKRSVLTDKRLSSYSQESGKVEAPGLGFPNQPGMREAGSYSSIVIHHDQHGGLFSSGDTSSASNTSDSRLDVSSSLSDIISNQRNVDSSLTTRGSRNSFGSSYQSRLRHQGQQGSISDNQGHTRQVSSPVSGSSTSQTSGHWSFSSGSEPEKQTVIGKAKPQFCSSYSGSQSLSDLRPAQTTVSAEKMHNQTSSSSLHLSSSISDNKRSNDDTDSNRSNRIGSDSVFATDFEDIEDDLEDYEFSRKPSMRKAYGIYDETERLIAQPKLPNSKTGSERQQLSKPTDSETTGYPVPAVRANRVSESTTLGKIQEESDSATTGHDADIAGKRTVVSGNVTSGDGKLLDRLSEKNQKYPWQNEAWRKSNIELPTGSNLKRTTSEQIGVLKTVNNVRPTSFDTDFKSFPKNGDSPLTKSSSSSFYNLDNWNTAKSSAPGVSPGTRLDDTRLNLENQLRTSRLNEPKSSELNLFNKHPSDTFSPDSSLYESIAGNRLSLDSVADVIDRVNENLARSAQRVDSMRRSSSSATRSPSDYVDMARERQRKETEWSRLRPTASMTSGSDNDRRSSRSSFASENLYEDISMFAPSTPRSSYAEVHDKFPEPEQYNSSMDSGLVASPTYQNLSYPRRPPPPPPQPPGSDEETPPALPPRKYRENPNPGSLEPQNTKIPESLTNSQMSPKVVDSVASPNHSTVVADDSSTAGCDSIDRSKRDFHSLMSQWQNCSPMEDRYAAELRKQAKKLTGNQMPQQQQQPHQLLQQPQHLPQQLLNSMPAAYERTKTTISLATSYKHEPMQPQEATAPVSSSSLSSSPSSFSQSSPVLSSTLLPHSNISTTSSSTSSSPPHSHPMLSSPLSSKSAVHCIATSHHSIHRENITSLTSRLESVQSTSPATGHSNAVNSSRNSPVVSSSVPLTSQASLEKSKSFSDEARLRSSSDSNRLSPPMWLGDIAEKTESYTSRRKFRERSSSEHDILSERQECTTRGPSLQKDDPTVHASKWRPGHRGADNPQSCNQGRGGQMVEIVSMKAEEQLSPAHQLLLPRPEEEQGKLTADKDGFADESYIGHRNKSSRAIGTYKRSKSAAVLQTGHSSDRLQAGSHGENGLYSEQKLGLQPWSSESVLTLAEESGHPPLEARQGQQTDGDRTRAAPVRPARPHAQGRHSIGQIQPPVSLSSASFSQTYKPPASSAPANGVPSKSSTTNQPSETSRQNPQRVSPSHGPDSNSNLYAPSYNYSTHRNEDRNLDNISPLYPSVLKSQISNDAFNNNNKVAAYNHHNHHHNPSNATPSISSSPDSANRQDDIILPLNNNSSSNSLSQRELPRRESVPTRPTPYPDSPSRSPDSRLGVPLEDLHQTTNRRRSDSSVNSSSHRSDYGSYDASSSSHSRQPSQEELECDQKVQQLAQELRDKDRKLSDVLRSDVTKNRMQYMDGLFCESLDAPGDKLAFHGETRSSSLKYKSPQSSGAGIQDKSEVHKRSSLPKEYWVSPSKAMLEMELRKNEETTRDLTRDISDSNSLVRHKEELIEKLERKLQVLKEEKVSLQQEITDNQLLGTQVRQFVEVRCQSLAERDKFKTNVEDLETIVRLLLNLSGQLARAENAVQTLSSDADANSKKRTIEKRERLFERHEEAKKLKEDIDRRSEQLSCLLKERLSDNEYLDYAHFIKMKSRLTIELQELDDKIMLGEEQIQELKKSIPDS